MSDPGTEEERVRGDTKIHLMHGRHYLEWNFPGSKSGRIINNHRRSVLLIEVDQPEEIRIIPLRGSQVHPVSEVSTHHEIADKMCLQPMHAKGLNMSPPSDQEEEMQEVLSRNLMT
jgi:hypothetical protein